MAVFDTVFKHKSYTTASILHEVLPFTLSHKTVDEDLNVVTFNFTSIKLLKCARIAWFLLCFYMCKHWLILNTSQIADLR